MPNIAAGAAGARAGYERTEMCKVMINTFDNLSSTVQEKQQYAQCVNIIYPIENQIPDIIWMVFGILWVIGLVFMLRMFTRKLND